MPEKETIIALAADAFAIPTLDALVAAGRAPDHIVLCPPANDAEEAGEEPSPVTAWAAEHGVELMTPKHLQTASFLEAFTATAPDLVLVIGVDCALPEEIVAAPAVACLKAHASLLPKLRGGSPIRAALNGGDNKTGVTVILVQESDEAIDSGAVLRQGDIEIGADETYGELKPRLATLAAELLVATLGKKPKKSYKGKAQNEKTATYALENSKRHHKIPWSLEANQIYNRLRAYSPHPGLTAYLRLHPVTVLRGYPLGWVQAPFGAVGTYLGMRQGRLAVLAGSSTVFGISRLCRPGKEPMSAVDFAFAEKLEVGDRFV